MLPINNIYCQDCLEGMGKIPDESIDLVVTDPPYKIISGGCRTNPGDNETSGILNRRRDWSRTDPKGVLSRGNKRNDFANIVRDGKMFRNNELSFSDWLPNLYRVLKPQTHCYIMVNDKNIHAMLNACESIGFKFVNMLVWKKNNCTPNKFYMKNIEFILMLRKGAARNINNMGSTQFLEFPNKLGNKLHPTEKPVALMAVLVGNSTDAGDVVLDPFMGSGTTAIACINTDRNFIGFEIDKEYHKVAMDRMIEAFNNKESM